MAEVINNDNVIPEAIARFLTQFKNSTQLKSLGGAYMGPMQGLEDNIQSLYEDRWIISAFGETLNKLGEMVGVPRNGRTDEEYRLAILSEITLQYSSGSIDDIIATAKTITGAGKIRYFENPPAGFMLNIVDITNGDTQNWDVVRSSIDGVRPAGVEFWIVVTYDDEESFSFLEDPIGLGFGTDYDLEVGGVFSTNI